MSALFSRREALGALGVAATAALTPAALAQQTPTRPRATGVQDEALFRLAGTCLMTGFFDTGLHRGVRALLERGALGGVLIGRHNFRTADELRALCRAIEQACPSDARALISADMEGGTVSHLAPPLTRFPAMPSLGQLDDAELTHRVGAALGAELRSHGLTMDLAPVLDVRTSAANTVVLGRCFGRTPEVVARHGAALVRGLHSAGVLACGKHFPGHGDTSVDSHAGLPQVPHNLERLDRVELVPYRALGNELGAVMLAHVVYRGLDPTQPATLSRRVATEVLRSHLGFTGVAVTDDLQMAAIARTGAGVPAAAELSMRAGCDLLLIAHSSGVARAVLEHLATTAARDRTLRARLEQAAQRVRELRARLATALPPNPYTVQGSAVVSEVERRLAARGQRERTVRDPTTARGPGDAPR